MSGTTATQNLVYPTGGDLIVAAGDAVEDLATRVDARLDAQDANLAVSQVPPFTVVESTELENLPSGFVPWPFDTVLVDTQDGANLGEDARRITLTRTGFWMLGGYAAANRAAGSVTVSFRLQLNVNNPGTGIQFENVENGQIDVNNGNYASCSTIARVDNVVSGTYCIMSAFVTGVTDSAFTGLIPVVKRRMWAYWLGDL